MGSKAIIVAVLGALACATLAHASDGVQRPPVQWAVPGTNFTPVRHRRITTIVIHATDGGSLTGNVSWLTGTRSEASAHYVVSTDGHIVQLVPLHDIAWHSGNKAMNEQSIGVEHVGDTLDPSGFTTAEYRSSARLVAWLARRYDIPVDRHHIIGHSEVPDPFHPGRYGGADHHTDPGAYWRWGYYMRLVRKFAFPNRLHVATTTIDPGATVTGVVPWRVKTKGAKARQVEFLIDGKLVWSDARAPFAFAGGRGWNTTQVANGRHVLTVRATGDGHAQQRLVVDVANHVFALTTSHLRAWQKVRGTFHVRANVRGASTTGLGLYVDRRLVSRDHKAPYSLRWNSRSVHDGLHHVTIAAVATDGRIVRKRLPLVVSNHPRPAHPQSPPPHVTRQNVADGEVVTGLVDWRAHTTGPVARVEFSVDGTVVATEAREPWATAWDSSTVAAGPHRLEVRAYTRDGQAAVLGATVTVSGPQQG